MSSEIKTIFVHISVTVCDTICPTISVYLNVLGPDAHHRSTTSNNSCTVMVVVYLERYVDIIYWNKNDP